MAARALVMARDAGAAAALSPVARALIREGRLGVSIVAFGQAAGVFRERGLPVLSFSESPTREQVESLLAREGARVVLTGTSMQASKDAAFWEAAAPRVSPRSRCGPLVQLLASGSRPRLPSTLFRTRSL